MAIQQAAHALHAGGVVAFPTETVYGLGALTVNERALDLVYELKGRPADNPLIAHVLDAAQAREIIDAGAWNERCDTLVERFWPVPLTLVLRKSQRVPARATAGRPTIAVRSPRHSVARALLEAVGQPISAPSANLSGHVSPTAAQHVMDEFANVPLARDLLILDGGPCDVGIESTVLDLSQTEHARILRPGAVTLEQLQQILGEVDAPDAIEQQASPGTSPLHYAPTTPAELVASHDLADVLRHYERDGLRCAVLCFDAMTAAKSHGVIRMPRDADRYAHDLYGRLREADALRCDRIVIEQPPETSDPWRAVHDRLRRATSTDHQPAPRKPSARDVRIVHQATDAFADQQDLSRVS